MSTRLPTRTGLIAPRFRCARIVQAEMASFSAVSAIENKSFIAAPFVSELILLNTKVSVLESSTMKRYLAEAGIAAHLAYLPEHAELRGRRSHEVCGVLGKEYKDVFASLKEPPHKVFVNWSPTPEGVLAFTRLYGLLDPNGKYYWEDPPDHKFSFRVASWLEYQKYFQGYWDGNSDGANWDVVRTSLETDLMPSQVIGIGDRHQGIIVNYLSGLGPRPYISLAATTLWQYLCALLIFHSVGDLRHCENPDCPAPRFIARRKDQIFCSGDCAGLVAKRRWWAKHGEEWRKRRKQNKLKRRTR
jgi:hypothetical protein